MGAPEPHRRHPRLGRLSARGGGDADRPQPCGALGRDRVMEAAFDAVAAGAQEIRLTVNGKPVALVVDPRERLSEALRHELGLTGTKAGCSAGDCGACKTGRASCRERVWQSV